MIIKSASEMIKKIIEFEKKKIEEFEIKITHNPTIGKQYEGITKKALDYGIPEELKMKVVSGFIKAEGKLSGQIDCMICVGEGQIVPGATDEYIYNIENVLAVIEIKKNMVSDQLKDSYLHLLDINKMKWDYSPTPVRRIHKAFSQITGVLIENREDVNKLDNELYKMIYHGLVSQYVMPLRIVIAYDGFKSEKSLREKFVSFMNSNHGKKGFGPFSLTDLTICGNNCLLKLNGEPYVPFIEDDFFEFFTSSSGFNLKILTELIYGRLSRYHNFDFSEDDKSEPLKYFLGAKLKKVGNKTGWEYVHHSIKNSEINSDINWKPDFISKEAYTVFQALSLENISINSDFFKKAKRDAPDIMEQLSKTRFIAIKDNTIHLTTETLQCGVLPDGRYFAAENNEGYLNKWISENFNPSK